MKNTNKFKTDNFSKLKAITSEKYFGTYRTDFQKLKLLSKVTF